MNWPDEVKRVLRDNTGVLTAAIGLACALVSMNGMRLNTVDGIYPVELSLVLRHLFGGLAALAVAFVYARSASSIVLSKTWRRVGFISTLFAVSLLLRYSQSLLTASTPVLVMVGKLSEELFGVLLILAWAERIVPRGFRVSATCLGIAMIVFSIIQTLLAFFQRVPSMFALVVLPLMSAILFKMYLAGQAQSDSGTSYEAARTVESAPWPADLRSPMSTILYFGILYVFVFIVGQLLHPSLGLQQQNMSSQLAIAFGNALSGLLFLFVAGESRHLQAQPRFVFSALFLSMFALTTVAFSLQGHLNSLTVVFYLAINTVVSGFASILKWLSPFAALNARWTPAMMIAVGYACNLLSRTTSSTNMLISQQIPSWPMELPTVLVLLVVFVLCTVFIMGMWEPGSTAPARSDDSPLDRTAASMSQEYGLTGQEGRVLVLCAQGMNARAISEEMVISLNTTKSHMRMLYAKLGVHSQQELIDLVSQRSAE